MVCEAKVLTVYWNNLLLKPLQTTKVMKGKIDFSFLLYCSIQFSLLCSLLLTYSLEYTRQSVSKVLTWCVSKRLTLLTQTHSAQLPGREACSDFWIFLTTSTLKLCTHISVRTTPYICKTCWLLLC